MKKIILISGKAENGKTTAANVMKKILEEKGYKVVITRYAKYLKEIAKDYCGWNGEKDDAGRTLLQQLGTEIIRKKMNKPEFHVGRICEDIEVASDYVDYVIIDDVRYPNEIYYPLAKFGKEKVVTYRVERMNLNGEHFINSLSEEQQRHLSETSLDNFDFDVTVYPSNLGEAEFNAHYFIDSIIKGSL